MKHPQGKQYWRSLEELAASDEFVQFVRREYPEQAAALVNGVSRRRFLTLMGASLALAGIGGCNVRPAPSAEMVPYVDQPEGVVPGKPLFFATAMTMAGDAVGLLVESHLGRPTKIEGNPDHPASRGATGIYEQASILTLYDPDRAKTPTYLGNTKSWPEVLDVIRPKMEELRAKRGAGFRLLTESIVSPTLAWQLEGLLADLPEAKWHVWEPVHRDTERRGLEMAFGEPVQPFYNFRRADVVLSLDADFLSCGPGRLGDAADFMAHRRVRDANDDATAATMNRLYVAETAVSCTGAKADHRLALRPAQVEQLARAVAAELGIDVDADAAGLPAEWIAAVAKDLDAHRGRSLVLAGDSQPPAVHLLAHLLNEQLGNVEFTVLYVEPNDARPVDRTESLRELVADMKGSRVEFLVILGGNPVYTAPADFDFAEQLKKVPLAMHHGLSVDETSLVCGWHLPESHYLEAWSDAGAQHVRTESLQAGMTSIVQPLVEPLYDSRSSHELVAMLTDFQETPGRQIVRDYWREQWEAGDNEGGFEPFWQKCLHDGVVPGTGPRFKLGRLQLPTDRVLHLQELARKHLRESMRPTQNAADTLDLVIQPDPTLYDGAWANNGWLQELSKPVTKLAWGNAAIMSPATARRLGVKQGSYAHGGEHGGYHMPVITLELDGRKVDAPTWIMPGHADGTITVWLGHGRWHAGRIGGSKSETVGFNAYTLRTAARPWFATGLKVTPTGRTELVACTQAHQSMEGREPVRAATLTEYRTHPEAVVETELEEEHAVIRMPRESLTLYDSVDYGPPKHKWAMAIDLTACTGCMACVVACQAENNIAVVGKDEVLRGREMHWLRVDRYVAGTPESPEAFHFQPVPCMHCENAPCEYVCPVEATVHSAEGLNDMVYNRCVGTRFCSNNCPYKVRRFNFKFYSDYETKSRRLQYNPDVTVRSRGVMEKCSYCVQRLRRAEVDSQAEDRPLRDGEVLTACQAACPASAIQFGDLNDPNAAVARWKASPLDYNLLDDTNTHPRTTYLAELKNPNPELEDRA